MNYEYVTVIMQINTAIAMMKSAKSEDELFDIYNDEIIGLEYAYDEYEDVRELIFWGINRLNREFNDLSDKYFV